MNPDREYTETKFDIRQYVGLFIFYWRFITLCLLLALAGAALYIQYVPRVYEATCSIMIARDAYLAMGGRRDHTPLQSFGAHTLLLNSDALQERSAAQLADEWASRVRTWRGGMLPDVRVTRGRGLGSMLDVSARGSHREYLEAFLKILVKEHEAEWRDLQTEFADNAVNVLLDELATIEDRITRAEEELIEFQRLHDIARIEAIGAHESRQLSSLIERRGRLSTEIMMLESQYPFLQDAGAGVIDNVDIMTRETAWMGMFDPDAAGAAAGSRGKPRRVHPLVQGAQEEGTAATMRDWQELRVNLTRLLETEEEIARNFTAEHPRRIALQKEIEAVRERLDTATRVRMQSLLDRREALAIQVRALENAEQSWQARNLLASRRKSELNRLAGVLRRFESNYNTLYSRLHDLRVSRELNAETFRIVRPIKAEEKPVWPDPFKILIVALTLGLGSGIGLTLLGDYFNNRIKFPRDIEQDLGQPFLGGIPYWAHSDLETMVRPNVAEHENAAAVEAYRTIRSTILDALDKTGGKIAVIASADSREGKTLTVLNVAILTARLGKRVLLLDMDLRRGRLHRSLDVDKQPGISGVLRSGRPLADAVVATRFENLYFAPAGDAVDNASELLSATGLAFMLEPLKKEYDYIFIDTSPILRATEAMIMCNKQVGSVVFVARVNRTAKPLVRYAFRMIKDAQILGIVVNYIELHRISSLYYVYQYPSASYSYYEYGRYGESAGENFAVRAWTRARHRAMRWVRRRLLS